MICDNCIMEIKKSLSKNAIKVFNILIDEGKLKRKEIQNKTNLTYAYTGKALKELKYKFLINSENVGRSNYFGLTKVGYRLAKLSYERMNNNEI